MKIAIHDRAGSFSDRWIEYCKANNIDYKVINAYDSDIVNQVSDCDAFLWHHHHDKFQDTLFARQLLFSLECSGKKVFPDWRTDWYFDDKVGQKYLLEAIGAPLVPSYVFYDKQTAFAWAAETEYPKVFKLRGGAGAENVILIHNEKESRKVIKKAFGKGFAHTTFRTLLKDAWRQYRKGKTSLLFVMKVVASHYIKPLYSTPTFHPERGYVYFQDFIADNTYDIRVCIVDNKAFALKRLVREGDFRASGSGNIVYDKKQIDENCVMTAFKVNDKLMAQSIAFDFVFDKHKNPLIVEISYGYATKAYDACEGYWDRNLSWHPGHKFNFCGWMIEGLLREK